MLTILLGANSTSHHLFPSRKECRKLTNMLGLTFPFSFGSESHPRSLQQPRLNPAAAAAVAAIIMWGSVEDIHPHAVWNPGNASPVGCSLVMMFWGFSYARSQRTTNWHFPTTNASHHLSKGVARNFPWWFCVVLPHVFTHETSPQWVG